MTELTKYPYPALRTSLLPLSIFYILIHFSSDIYFLTSRAAVWSRGTSSNSEVRETFGRRVIKYVADDKTDYNVDKVFKTKFHRAS